MSRYDRQMRIEGWKQERLEKATALVAGVGALGSFVSTNLALSGVGRIYLVDMDTIEISNLNRQFLFRKKDVRKFKADVATKRLQEINPDIEIVSFPLKLEDIKRSYYQQCDVIVAGLDTFPARRWLNSMAVDLKKPLISGGMYGFMGHVQRIIPHITPCFECQPLIPQEKLSQACSPVGEKRKHLPKKPEAPIPSIATLSMIIGGFLSQEAIKYLLKVGTPLNNYLFYDGLSNTITILELERNKKCPVCGESFTLQETAFQVEDGETVEAIITRVAYAFGLAEPKLMLQGIILEKSTIINSKNLKNGAKIFVMDERLAKPLKLIIQKQK